MVAKALRKSKPTEQPLLDHFSGHPRLREKPSCQSPKVRAQMRKKTTKNGKSSRNISKPGRSREWRK